MIFEEKTLTLKDGRTAILKTPEIEDAEQMLRYVTTASGETEFLATYPEEWHHMTVEKEAKWVESLRTSDNEFDIACYLDGQVIGNCELSFHTRIKSAHRATVGIAILKDYWNLGIGSAFFCEMIAAAQAHGTEIMELEFLEGNDRARYLYEKYGFAVVCEKPRAFRLKDGSYRSEFYMQKYL